MGITIKARLLKSKKKAREFTRKVRGVLGYYCPCCQRIFKLWRDRKYITFMYQTGKEKDGHYTFCLGFICPDCVTDTTIRYRSTNSATPLLNKLNIYRHQ